MKEKNWRCQQCGKHCTTKKGAVAHIAAKHRKDPEKYALPLVPEYSPHKVETPFISKKLLEVTGELCIIEKPSQG